jgi:hypothetical protein
MTGVPNIRAEVTFLPTTAGGRRSLPSPISGQYMPHLVVEGGAEYLGVRFVAGPQPEFGVRGEFVLALAYHPNVDYSALVPGAAFTVREGTQVVGAGRVIESVARIAEPSYVLNNLNKSSEG